MIRTRGGSDHFPSAAFAGETLVRERPFSAAERVDALLSRGLGESWGAAGLAELRSLRRERDPELFFEALLGLGRRLEARGRLEAAGEIYATVVQEADAVGAVPPLTGDKRERPLRIRAQESLDAILGRGAFGPRAEFLLRDLARQSSDPAMLFAMGTAGAVFRMMRLMTLSRLVARQHPGFLTQLLGAGRLASLTAFALEAPAFTLAARLGNEALGRSQDWGGRALGRDVASSYLVLGGMKLAGWGSGAAYRGIANPVGALRACPPLRGERPLQLLFQQGGMLTGILLGHSLEEHFGLRPHRDGATTLTDSLAMLLQFHVAGRLTRHAFGPSFAAWEAGLDLRASRLALPRPPAFRGPFGLDGFAFAQAVPAGAASRPPRRPELGRPQVLMMVGRGRGGGRTALPAEARFHLSQIEHENGAVALASTARLQEMLRTGEGLSSRQYVEVFRQLYRKTDANIEAEAYDLIVDGLNVLLTRVSLREPGPRALFREMTRPELAEELIVPGFYAAWMKNPSLGRSGRRRIADRVLEILRRDDFQNDLPHDQALTLLAEVWHLPQLEPSVFRELVQEAIRFAGRHDSWFHEFQHTERLVENILTDVRVPEKPQRQLLEILRRGVRDANLRSQSRVDILEQLESLAKDPRVSERTQEWLRFQLPILREIFLRENLAEVREYGRRITNFAELGYLLSRDYVAADVKALLAQELLAAFRGYPPTTMGYDHLVTVAQAYALHPWVPREARFHLWTILCKASLDMAPHLELGSGATRRVEQWGRVLPATFAAMPGTEREAFAATWLGRLRQGPPEQRVFAARTLEAMLPYLEPNFDLRRRLKSAAEGNLLEVQASVHRVISHWNRVN